jgi:hypothetical protein
LTVKDLRVTRTLTILPKVQVMLRKLQGVQAAESTHATASISVRAQASVQNQSRISESERITETTTWRYLDKLMSLSSTNHRIKILVSEKFLNNIQRDFLYCNNLKNNAKKKHQKSQPKITN